MPDAAAPQPQPDFARLVQERALLTQGYGWGTATVADCMKWVQRGKDGEPLNPYELVAVLSEVVARQGEAIDALAAKVASLVKAQAAQSGRLQDLDTRTIGSMVVGGARAGQSSARPRKVRPPSIHPPEAFRPPPGDLGHE